MERTEKVGKWRKEIFKKKIREIDVGEIRHKRKWEKIRRKVMARREKGRKEKIEKRKKSRTKMHKKGKKR